MGRPRVLVRTSTDGVMCADLVSTGDQNAGIRVGRNCLGHANVAAGAVQGPFAATGIIGAQQAAGHDLAHGVQGADDHRIHADAGFAVRILPAGQLGRRRGESQL